MDTKEITQSTLFKLAVRLSTAALFLSTYACCSTNPSPQSTVVLSTCGDGGIGDSGDEEFAADDSAEALGLSTPCARACNRLAQLGCPESRKPVAGKTCIETCTSISAISSFSPACVTAAKDVTSVRKCPQVRCLR